MILGAVMGATRAFRVVDLACWNCRWSGPWRIPGHVGI